MSETFVKNCSGNCALREGVLYERLSSRPSCLLQPDGWDGHAGGTVSAVVSPHCLALPAIISGPQVRFNLTFTAAQTLLGGCGYATAAARPAALYSAADWCGSTALSTNSWATPWFPAPGWDITHHVPFKDIQTRDMQGTWGPPQVTLLLTSGGKERNCWRLVLNRGTIACWTQHTDQTITCTWTLNYNLLFSLVLLNTSSDFAALLNFGMRTLWIFARQK